VPPPHSSVSEGPWLDGYRNYLSTYILLLKVFLWILVSDESFESKPVEEMAGFVMNSDYKKWFKVSVH
jgi:hypothetical protein